MAISWLPNGPSTVEVMLAMPSPMAVPSSRAFSATRASTPGRPPTMPSNALPAVRNAPNAPPRTPVTRDSVPTLVAALVVAVLRPIATFAIVPIESLLALLAAVLALTAAVLATVAAVSCTFAAVATFVTTVCCSSSTLAREMAARISMKFLTYSTALNATNALAAAVAAVASVSKLRAVASITDTRALKPEVSATRDENSKNALRSRLTAAANDVT